jgi:hypothetical protein
LASMAARAVQCWGSKWVCIWAISIPSINLDQQSCHKQSDHDYQTQ